MPPLKINIMLDETCITLIILFGLFFIILFWLFQLMSFLLHNISILNRTNILLYFSLMSKTFSIFQKIQMLTVMIVVLLFKYNYYFIVLILLLVSILLFEFLTSRSKMVNSVHIIHVFLSCLVHLHLFKLKICKVTTYLQFLICYAKLHLNKKI